MDYKDTPNERILNLFTGLEGFLVNYIASNPKDKEEAVKYLGYIRKGIEEKYEDLPAPPESRAKKPAAAPAPTYTPGVWGYPEQVLQAAGLGQAQQVAQANVPAIDWGTHIFWRR
jgi:hypothetical protein